jgi:tyrosine aminotransferase
MSKRAANAGDDAASPKRGKQASPAASTTTTSSPDDDGWELKPSNVANQTINYIRTIVDGIAIPAGTEAKPMLRLSIGDPSVFGNLDTHSTISDAVAAAVKAGKSNGYGPAHGLPKAREAVVKATPCHPEHPITPNDVIIASGASGALVIAISGLCGAGDNILIPQPCFSLYITIAEHYGIKAQLYELDSQKHWECDLADMEKKIDKRTRAILVNNPGNPTGSNYSREHLTAVLALAAKHHLPVISDEIYGPMVWDGDFHSIATISTDVPVICISGIAKQQLVPGWRLGWMTIHDRAGRFERHGVHAGLMRLSQVIVGATTPIQAALPDILSKPPTAFFEKTKTTLKENGQYLEAAIAKIPGLRATKPQGAMYMMVEVVPGAFKELTDGTSFADKLLNEEFVFVLPGACFKADQFFRIVTAPPRDILTQAIDRLTVFCKRHHK